MNRTITGRFLVALLVVSGVIHAVQAEEGDTGWSDTAELSWVVTAGNSDTSTLGFKNTLTREWERSSFELKAAGVRAETTTVTDRFAVGLPGSFSVSETEDTETTAEQYLLTGRYDRKIHERFFWFGGAGWDRNRPAGVENRYTAFGGVGNIWRDDDKITFKTDYSATYTDQEDVVEPPDFDGSFVGARLAWVYSHRFGESTSYGNDFEFDANLEESDDFRAKMVNSLSVAINKRLALKVSLAWIYDNQPALEEIALFDMDPAMGGAQTGTVFVELDDLDTIFTTSLVVNF